MSLRLSLREEAPDDPEKLVQPVAMEPVPGALDAEHPRVAKVRRPPVLGGIARAALLAIQEQRWAGDPRPEQLDVAAPHIVGRPGPNVVVELPAVGPVLVLVGAVHGQVAGLLRGEMRVFLLHAAEGVFDRGVATGKSRGEAPLLVDPLVDALDDRLGGASLQL